MRCPLISVHLLRLFFLLCSIIHIGRGEVIQLNRRIKRDGSTRLSGRGGVDIPVGPTSLISCLLPGLSDLLCIGPRVTLNEPKQLLSTGQTGRAFGYSDGADLRFLAPYNVPYVGENTNAGTFIGAKVADGNVEFGQETNILNFFKAGIFANIGTGNQNSFYPPIGGGGTFPRSSIYPSTGDYSGQGTESNPFPNYIPPPSSSNQAGKLSTSDNPFPNYIPPPATRISVPTPEIEYEYTDQASKVQETTESESDPFDPFPSYIPPPRPSETKNPPIPSHSFLSNTLPPPWFPTVRVPKLSTVTVPTGYIIPQRTTTSAPATPISIGDELVPFAHVPNYLPKN